MRIVFCAFVVAVLFRTAAAGCAYTPDSNGHVDINDTDTSIAADAFEDCLDLITVNIPDSVESIASNAFDQCHTDLVCDKRKP